MKKYWILSILLIIVCVEIYILGSVIFKESVDENINVQNFVQQEEQQVPENVLYKEDIETDEQMQEQQEIENDELIIKEYEINGQTYEVIAELYIPTLEIQYPVFSSTSKELLKVSLNKYWGPNPNTVGNFCIVGHNYNDDQFFGKLNRIKIGDVIELSDMSGRMLQYFVYDTYIVNPDNTDCTSQLTDGRKEITLITCTKDFQQRFIVKAKVAGE